MKEFIGLSTTNTEKRIGDCDFICYCDKSHSNTFNLDNKIYYIFDVDVTNKTWNTDDDIIDIIYHDNIIIAKFEKIADYDNLQIWKKS
ncbi:hypothetical protein M0Q97_11795 [Candidatus Dojkabacteria bacterium]|jgi:hypothetical protein|nr:hypothetical protein [Candidatus Dojkabacteria bacterium]